MLCFGWIYLVPPCVTTTPLSPFLLLFGYCFLCLELPALPCLPPVVPLPGVPCLPPATCCYMPACLPATCILLCLCYILFFCCPWCLLFLGNGQEGEVEENESSDDDNGEGKWKCLWNFWSRGEENTDMMFYRWLKPHYRRNFIH